MDFTVKTYKTLLNTLIREGYKFQTFQEFITNPQTKTIILRPACTIAPAGRHDVDKLSAKHNLILFLLIY